MVLLCACTKLWFLAAMPISYMNLIICKVREMIRDSHEAMMGRLMKKGKIVHSTFPLS